MRTIFIFILVLGLGGAAWGTTYYVSSSSGSDGNSGTSAGAAWATVGHVNAQTFQPGDSVLFKRGDVWNESLIPPSSGSSGNAITFDAYGTGAPPNLSGYYAIPAAKWVLVTGNAWKAPVPATFATVNFCLFGSIWGQKVPAVSSNLTAQWDFYLANGYLYVYSVGSPATYYNEPVVPMALSNIPVINVNGKSWLTIQHLLVNWFDDYGVYVQGASDHLVFANMEMDSMIPQGTQPLGLYVNESAPGPGDIKIYNANAHMNYDGFRFDGAATAITLVNDKAYGNRDSALVDNTGAVSYSFCHFYASSLAVAGSTDVTWTSGTGPIAGAGNIATDTPAAVQVWQRYPAEVTLTVDDAGMTAGADTYYANTVLPIADAEGVPVGAAVTVGYSLAQTLAPEFQSWINAGRDVTAHSISHTYYTNTNALAIQYTGSGTAATMSIGNKTLTITVTGASDGMSCSLVQSWTTTQCGTIQELMNTLNATGKFTASLPPPPCQGPYGTGCSYYTASALLAQDLADVSSQDVKSGVYQMQLDVTRLTTDEITLSRQWMTANLTGLPATPVYVYPGGYETPTMQGIAAGVPYSGARGALKEDLGVKDTYASGFDLQNVTSFGVNPSWMGSAGVTPALLNQKIQALVWKQQVWGGPWGVFWHLNELTENDPVGGTEITNLIHDFKNSGATIQTNTSLVNWLATGTLENGTDGNFYYKMPAQSMALDFRPTASSPVVDAGQNLGTAYQTDINGVNQNSYGSGWEIGANVYIPQSTYGEMNAPTTIHFSIGGASITQVTLPQIQILAPGAGTSVPAVNTYLKPSPYINAIVYSLYWSCSDQDGTAAHYTWSNFDNQVTADGWPAAGKKIIVVLGGVTYGGTDSICYGGGGSGSSGVGNYGTPAYVWTALGQSNYVSCTCNGGTQQIPNYLNSAYLNNYKNWIAATLAHLSGSSYGNSIQYVRVAWGKGGETTPIASWDGTGICPDGGGNNTLTTDWGYTLAGWEGFLQNGMTWEAGLGSPLQLMISITPMGPSGGSQATVPNFTAPIAAGLHIGFGTQGLMASDVNNAAGCGGNWCQLFATYTGQVPVETQTYYQSCATSNEDGTCPTMAVTTGPLNPLLTWSFQEHTTSFEMYYEDACSMLCPGYGVAGYAAYPQPSYVAAMVGALVNSSVCGPPLFRCSRMDANMVDVPLPAPASIGTGFSGASATAAIDTSLASAAMVRGTDGNWLSSSGGLNGFSISAGVGASAEPRIWSIDHQLIYVGDQGGGYEPAAFLGFGVTGNALQRLYTQNSAYSPNGLRLTGGGEFSPTNSRWLYYKSGGLATAPGQISIANLSNWATQTAAPTITLVLDFSEGFTPGYVTGGTAGQVTYAEFMGVANDGGTNAIACMDFSNNTGGQGTGYLMVCAQFNPSGTLAGTSSLTNNVYTTFDFSTNTIYSTAYNGSAWVQTTTGTITGDHPSFHNARVNRNGSYAIITPSVAHCIGTCAGSYYDINITSNTAATLYEMCTAANPCGHETQGYTLMAGNGGPNRYLYGVTLPTVTNNYAVLPFCTGTYPSFTNVPCDSPVTDSHLNWDLNNGLDFGLIVQTTTTNTGPEPPDVETGIGPWRNEVLGIDPSTGLLHRFGHTFETTMGSQNGPYVIGVPSGDGYAVAVTSDWHGGFGKNDNTGTGACVYATDYWRANFMYPANVNVRIISGTNNAGTYIYNSGTGGTTGSSIVSMNQTVGGTTTDGTVTWTNQGTYNCRTDVVIYQMQ